jgi:hypothetical protein
MQGKAMADDSTQSAADQFRRRAAVTTYALLFATLMMAATVAVNSAEANEPLHRAVAALFD